LRRQASQWPDRTEIGRKEDPALTITRREFLEGAAALALMGGIAAATGQDRLSLVTPAAAQTIPMADLLAPGPLPDQVLGAAEAPVTIVEYASMTCSHCAAFHEKTYPELKKRYIDTVKVRFIFREFPLDPLAAAGFMLARCAGDGKYFPMVETLFHTQKIWVQNRPLPALMLIAKQAGISEQKFNECIKDPKLRLGIKAVQDQAVKLRVQSTPSFFVNGKQLVGNYTLAAFEKAMAPYLNG